MMIGIYERKKKEKRREGNMKFIPPSNRRKERETILFFFPSNQVRTNTQIHTITKNASYKRNKVSCTYYVLVHVYHSSPLLLSPLLSLSSLLSIPFTSVFSSFLPFHESFGSWRGGYFFCSFGT